LPFFKDKKFLDITTLMVQKFIQLKKEENCSNSRINDILKILKSIFSKLHELNLISINPAKQVKKLNVQRKEIFPLNKAEIKLLLNTAKTHFPSFYPMLMTAIFTGIRQGELIALTWNDVDFQNNFLKISKNYSKGHLLTPKTKKSYRKVEIPDSLKQTLEEWKEKCLKTELDLVFPNKIGTYIDKNNMVQREFSRTFKLAGLRKIRWHDLRHTYASLLIAESKPINYIQAQLGHTSIEMTMDTYGHLFPDSGRKNLAVFDDIL